jgi:hypothetical protein
MHGQGAGLQEGVIEGGFVGSADSDLLKTCKNVSTM